MTDNNYALHQTKDCGCELCKIRRQLSAFATEPLAVGDIWHVRRDNMLTLDTVEILEVTKRTILISSCRQSYDETPYRYEKGSIELIEKVEPE